MLRLRYEDSEVGEDGIDDEGSEDEEDEDDEEAGDDSAERKHLFILYQ